jgi:hypothetical protein
MGLSRQQGPLSPGTIGRIPVPEPLPKRLLYAEPLRRRMRVCFGGAWIADREHALLLFYARKLKARIVRARRSLRTDRDLDVPAAIDQQP